MGDNLHNLMTLLMFIFGTMHYASMLEHCTTRSKLRARICIYCIISAFIMNIIIIESSEMVPSLQNFKFVYGPYTYYYVEAFGVTAMNIFPWAWESQREEAYWSKHWRPPSSTANLSGGYRTARIFQESMS